MLNSSTDRRSKNGRCRLFSFAGASLLYAAVSASALEFNIRQIADDSRMNREPVISETGLIAWYNHGTNEHDITISDISALVDGELKVLTEGSHGSFFGSVKPTVHSNTIVWIASFNDAGQGVDSWVLKEVPNRDDGAPELPAMYTAHEEGGKQWYENAYQGTTNYDETGKMVVQSNDVRRKPSGAEEVCLWDKDGSSSVQRVTHDYRHDFAPSTWGNLVSWQVERGWPFGWEIMCFDRKSGEYIQLTTNYYYDMAPKVFGDKVTWYGWDGHDFEIYLYDHAKKTVVQVTSNQYDDVSPVIWGDQIAWEGYPAAESDIFLYRDGKIEKISDNIEDDFAPRIWNGKVIWQGFDGDDFEIYYYDPEKSPKAIKLTSNLYDDTNPDLMDGLACWMGYFDNWDAEIFVWDINGEPTPTMITDNDDEDREPRTGHRQVVWQAERDGKLGIYLATPK